jgi:cytidine deaminase
LQLANEVGWRSKENETKIPFQSCGNRASELQMTTGENQSEIQVILNDEGHKPHTTPCGNKLVRLVDVTDTELVNTQEL